MKKAIFTTHQDTANLLERSFARYSKKSYTPANLIKSISTTKAANTLWSETHTYDAAGNRKTTKDKDNQTNTYAYDALNQLTSASIAGGSSVSNKPECILNTAGATTISATCRLSHNVQVQGNITIASNSTFIIASNAKLGINLHQHHIHGLTSSSGLYLEPGASIRNTVTPTPAGASTGINLSYTYDAFGNRKSKTKNGATTNYNYNNANELTGTTGASTTTISHNTNGDITNDGTYSYAYNSQHQLTNITGNGKSIEYKYHGADRYKKMVNGIITYYLNTGDDLSAELDASGNVITTYVGSVAEIKNTGAITYKSVDTMGSVVLLTDASGAVQGAYTYLPFGEATHTGSANSNLTFTNQEADSESNLMYYNARYYNPELGRFMNRDVNRRGDVLTHNDYAYTRNNPFKYTDPSGDIEEHLKKAKKYIKKTVQQVIYGNYTDEYTGLGTTLQIGAGFTGVDAPADLRDVFYDLSHWKWSWSHAGNTVLDTVGLVPVVGVVKNLKHLDHVDEAKNVRSLDTLFKDADNITLGHMNTSRKIKVVPGDKGTAQSVFDDFRGAGWKDAGSAYDKNGREILRLKSQNGKETLQYRPFQTREGRGGAQIEATLDLLKEGVKKPNKIKFFNGVYK